MVLKAHFHSKNSETRYSFLPPFHSYFQSKKDKAARESETVWEAYLRRQKEKRKGRKGRKGSDDEGDQDYVEVRIRMK